MPDTTLTSAELDELERLAKAATDVEPEDLMRYEHGDGRLAVFRPDGRDLIADFYGDGADRDYYGAANPATILCLLSLARAGLEAGKAEESMRERAAGSLEALIENLYGEPSLQAHHERQALSRGVRAIRALPLTTAGDKP